MDSSGERSIPVNEEVNSGATKTVEHEAYGIQYAPRNAIKGQVMANFLADIIAEDRVPPGTYKSSLTRMKPRCKERSKEIQRASNDHGSGAGLILIDSEGAEYPYTLRLNFTNSNNDAEYKALLAGLRIAAKMKVKKMHAGFKVGS
ncbi:reverse transcriptase domain-containing protein [Tanacetum coccineum]